MSIIHQVRSLIIY